jgi:hypothetical protein
MGLGFFHLGDTKQKRSRMRIRQGLLCQHEATLFVVSGNGKRLERAKGFFFERFGARRWESPIPENI